MNKRYILLTGFLTIVGLVGCRGEEERRQATLPQPVVSGVTVTPVIEEAIPDMTEVVGTVKARNTASIAARIAGTVNSVKVSEGDRVGKGQLLATIDAAEAQAGAAGAAAGVEQAQRSLDEAKARKQLAEATFDRYSRLFHEEAVTKQEYETRLMEKEVARQGVAQAEAQLVRARQEAVSAGTLSGYRRLTSPVSGIVTAKTVDPGMTVFPGTPLLTVEEPGEYRLELAAPESLSGKVRAGMVISVTVDQVPAVTEGRVVEVVPAVDPATRTFTIKIAVAGQALRSGMYGRAQFPLTTAKGVAVPTDSLLQRGALAYVWVVDNSNTAHLRLVKTGRTIGKRTEIVAGLAAGERIITAGVGKAVEGAKIQ